MTPRQTSLLLIVITGLITAIGVSNNVSASAKDGIDRTDNVIGIVVIGGVIVAAFAKTMPPNPWE
jgi:hypothetical protein